MKKKHLLTSVRTVYTITCGSCGEQFEDSSEDQLIHSYPAEIADGDWVECADCGAELELTSDESDQGDDDDDDSDDESDDGYDDNEF